MPFPTLLVEMNERNLAECREALRALKAGEIRTYSGNVDTTQSSIDLMEQMIESLEQSNQRLREMKATT